MPATGLTYALCPVKAETHVLRHVSWSYAGESDDIFKASECLYCLFVFRFVCSCVWVPLHAPHGSLPSALGVGVSRLPEVWVELLLAYLR